MAAVIHLRCRHCGELLQDREQEYCPPCNLYLAYRAMPLLLGMLLLGRPAAAGADGSADREDEGQLDLAAINWE